MVDNRLKTGPVGIDFGTSNSSAAIYDGKEVHLLPIDPSSNNAEVARTILYITRDQQQYVGEEAVQLYYKQNIGRRRHFVKKWVGEIEYRGADMFYVTDVYAYIDELQPGRLLQYLKTALRTTGYTGTSIFDQHYSVEDLVASYLRIIKTRIEVLLERQVTEVVLGRPVHFANTPEADSKAEQQLINAANQAGFANVQIELEPIAAALEYESGLTQPENILVFDFGGGTLDITVMRVGDRKERQVLSTGGVDIAGGLFDAAIIRSKLLGHFGYDTTYGPNRHPFPRETVERITDWLSLPSQGTVEVKSLLDQAIQTSSHPCRIENLRSLIFNEYGFSFYNEVERAKILLSRDYCAAVDFQRDDISIWQMLTRSQFERIIAVYREGVENCLLSTLNASGLNFSQIDRVVTTGGSSSIPVFIDMLANIFGRAKLKPIDLFTSVTAGLAIRAFEVFG